ncbi:MAG: EAL domain-containing protein [Acidobacteria bacterium]|nr:EAL domain-containing protein [Acidobacteriota bacterium]
MMQSSTSGAEEVRRLQRRFEREHSARLAAEAIAEEGLRELYARQQQLLLLEAIAAAANQSKSVESALQFALTAVCESTGWPLGHAYLVPSEGAKRLRSTGIWHRPQAGDMRAFFNATEMTDFEWGAGLPGRVLVTSAPAWIADVTAESNFPRAHDAMKAGLKSAFAFPVLVGTDVAAVLEFFSDKASTPDQILLRLMSQIGTQLGRVIERKRAENDLLHDASHDPLTTLPNRVLFLELLARAVARNQRRPETMFAVLFIDLDRFKVVNDSLGHHAGDHLLVEVAARLSASLRQSDMVARSNAPRHGTCDTLARLGGDEFTILLDDLSDLSEAVGVADRIQKTLAAPFVVEGQEFYASASIGIASSKTGYTSADAVLRDADLAMYRAKTFGKARYEIYDQTMHEAAINRLTLETNLRKALKNEEFVLHYQPIVLLSTAEIIGFEALVRWQKPDSDLVYPGDFIDVAEDTGLILFIGMWVLREACRTMRLWQQEFPRQQPLIISINVSARQFAQQDIVQQIRQIIHETGIDPHTVKLEITESVTMDDAERTVRVLSELKELGVRFSIDDFGTGYSSFSYLHRFPVDTLKIDRSFISRMEQSGESFEIVQTIMHLSRNLGMQVVAEGTETEAHVETLRSLGCDFGQGYFFSKPLSNAAAHDLLQASTPMANAPRAKRPLATSRSAKRSAPPCAQHPVISTGVNAALSR